MNKRLLIIASILILTRLDLFAQTNWSWVNKNGPFGSTVFSIAMTSGGTLVAATNNGVFLSSDAGANWSKASVSSNTTGFVGVAISSGGTIYAMQNFYLAGTRGIYASTDNGASWSLLAATGLTNAGLSKIKIAPKGYIYVVPNSSGQIYRSSDGGATFSLATTMASNINDIAIDGNNKVVVATTASGVQVSTTDGISFNAVGTGMLASATSYSLAIDASNNLYALNSDAPYRSTNGGSNWASIKGLITDVSFTGLVTVDASNNLYIVNSISLKLYVSTNPTNATPTWSAGTNPFSSNGNAINCIVMQNSTTGYVGRSYTGVDKSTDGGSTWSASASGIKGMGGSTNRIFRTATNGRLLYTAGASGYFLSIDEGANWNLIASTNANRTLYGFVKLSDGSTLGYGNGVIRSIDEGSNWTVQNSGVSIFNFPVVTYDGIKLYYSVSTDISQSTNQGVTWTNMGVTGLSGNTIQAIAPDNAGNLYLRVFNNSASQYEVWKINNATTAAAKLSAYPGGSVSDVKVVGANVYVVSGTNMYKSTNGGGAWTATSTPSTTTGIFLYDDLNIIIATSGGVYNSSDGGASWYLKSLQDASLGATLSDVFFGPDQSAYAATFKSVMQKSSTPVVPPIAPSGLAINARSVEGVDLIFTDNATNETAYLVEASIGNNTNYQQVANFQGSFSSPQNLLLLNNSGIVADSVTTYFFRVRASNAAGNSSYSNEVSGTGLKNCISTIPDNRSWTAVATADPGSTASGPGPFTNATVSIVKVPNSKNAFTVSLYDLGVCPTSVRPATTTATFFETCGTTYFQRDVNSNDGANGNGTWNGTTLTLKWEADPSGYDKFQGTTTFTLNSSDPVPATPSITAYVFSGTQNLLIWNTVSFATQYVIERSTVSNTFSGPPLATVNFPVIQYADATVTAGTTYYYRITAKNATGSSTPSGQTALTTPSTTLFSPLQNSMANNTDSQQGVSWADLDNDGDEDYISPSLNTVAGQSTVPVFYENTGGGQFKRRTLAVLQNENIASYRGACVSDLNNDGKLDMYFPRSTGNVVADFILINGGNWNFTKQAISQTARANSFRGASLADYDRDGLVDILTTDTDADGTSATTPTVLLRNTSSGGTVSFNQIMNAGTIITNSTAGRDISWADFNNDGLQDAFVISTNFNGTIPSPNIPNRLYKNNGDGTFTQVTGIFDTDIFLRARTSSWGDIDNDGDLDLYVGSVQTTVADRLYRNNGDGTFTSLTSSAAAENGTATFGSAFGDIDNDGDLDLIAINNGQANSIFINDGTGTFTKSTTNELITNPTIANIGGSFVDYDQNGFLDISTGRQGGSPIPPYLFQNNLTANASRNWVEVKLTGSVSNVAAIGARITVTTTSPARTQIREIAVHSGYGSQASLIQHFGLGTATSISQIQIKWPNGGTQTLTNPSINQLINITEDFTGPTFGTLSPANGSNTPHVNTTLSFTLNENGTAVGGKNINVYLASNTSTPVFSVAATSGSVSSNTYTYTLPQLLTASTAYTLSIDAGAFKDIYGNSSSALSLGSWQFTTAAGPNVSALSPANGASGVPVNTTFSVTLSGATTAAAGKNINVYLASNTSTPVFTIAANAGSSSGNTYTYTPPQALQGGTNYSLSIDAGAFIDSYGAPSLAVATGGWLFATADVTPPVISFTTVATLPKASLATSKFTVTATDNASISSVVMSYRKVTFTQFQTLSSTPGSAPNTFDFPLQASYFDDMGIEYFFTAKDPSNNTTVSPANGHYITGLTFDGAAAAVVGVPSGSQVSDYKIISVPLTITSNSVANIFSAFGAPDAKKWRLLKYQDSPQSWLKYPDDFSAVARGEGYFVISREGQNLTFQGAAAPTGDQSNLFKINLVAGFNLIGNPYTVPIDWEDSRVTGVGAIKIFQGGNYVDGKSSDGTSVIQPYSGGFVFAQSPVQVSVKMKISSGEAKKKDDGNVPTGSRYSADNWIVPIRMTQGQRQFNFGGVGMNPNASLSYDDADDFTPPSPDGTFEMRFPHPEHFMKNFARDVVPSSGGYTWQFNVDIDNEQETTLTWDASAVSDELYLLDLSLQRPINMRTTSSYTFLPGSSGKYQVFYGTDVKDKLAPTKVTLGDAYPNPSSNAKVTIPFTLPESQSAYHVEMDIYNSMGQKVSTIVNGSFNPGFYSSQWEPNENLLSGVYIYRLKVAGKENSSVVSKKLVINH